MWNKKIYNKCTCLLVGMSTLHNDFQHTSETTSFNTSELLGISTTSARHLCHTRAGTTLPRVAWLVAVMSLFCQQEHISYICQCKKKYALVKEKILAITPYRIHL